jgi:hypothetical protein
MFSNMFRNKPGFPNRNKLAIRLMYVTDGWMSGHAGKGKTYHSDLK